MSDTVLSRAHLVDFWSARERARKQVRTRRSTDPALAAASPAEPELGWAPVLLAAACAASSLVLALLYAL